MGNDVHAWEASDELVQVIEENARLRRRVEELEQTCSDLDIALATAVEHGDLIEASLYAANSKLRTEVRDRVVAERRLARVLMAVRQQKTDLELLVQTITEHSDAIDAQWLRRYAEAENLSRLDPLTGLSNRREVSDLIEQEWRRCTRAGLPVALIMADIDYFKGFNDTYGHVKGDEALICVAEAMRSVCHRPGDAVGRMGGEEFLLLLPATDITGAEVIAENLRQAVRESAIPYDSGPEGLLTLSMGVAAAVPAPDSDWADLLADADNLLYIAKRGGRNAIRLPDEMMTSKVGGEGA